jgi:hypothetical protein
MSPSKLFLPASVVALLTLPIPGAVPGEPDKPKGPAGPPDAAEARAAEARFADGSIVRLTVVQDQIEVLTQFGKLSVPPRDVRRIEFGLHLPEEVERKIVDAVQRLSSASHRQRELAQRELVGLGPQAYLALQRASLGKDREAATRAEIALRQITQKVPARLLRLTEEDRVYTTKFTIIGRVVTPTIRARAEYFGELYLKPSQLVTLRLLQGNGESELEVDAVKYGSAPDQWMDTGITVEAQVGLRITAAGQVDLWPQQPGRYMAGPEGMQGGGAGGQRRVARGGNVVSVGGGTLIGRIGENGSPFVIGERFTQAPRRAGRLYFHIIPSPWGGPSTGAYQVRVTAGGNVGEDEEE